MRPQERIPSVAPAVLRKPKCASYDMSMHASEQLTKPRDRIGAGSGASYSFW